MHKLLNNKGLTLIEMMLALAFLGVALAIGFNVFFVMLHIFDDGTARADSQQTSRLVGQLLEEELRNAGEIKLSNTTESGFNFLFSVRDNALYKNGNKTTNPKVSDITIKVENDNTLIIQISTYDRGNQELITEKSVYMNNIDHNFSSDYENFRSIKDFSLYFNHP